MTRVLTLLAEGGDAAYGNLPLEGHISPLVPLPYDMVWSGVCFIVILVLFWKYILPKYNEVLDAREEAISGSIARAETAQEEAKAALEKYNAQLADARSEASNIREEARAQGRKIVQEAETKASEESDRIISAGEKQLAAERERVVSELRQEMGQHSIDLAEALLGGQLDDSVKRGNTINNFLNNLDNVALAGK